MQNALARLKVQDTHPYVGAYGTPSAGVSPVSFSIPHSRMEALSRQGIGKTLTLLGSFPSGHC
jgi:hypothetical protein